MPIATTGPAERRLRKWGFTGATALDTWDSWTASRGDERLRVTAVPGRHGPPLLHRALPPVMGSILELERGGRVQLRVYLTGDTLCGNYLRPIHEPVHYDDYGVFRSPLSHFQYTMGTRRLDASLRVVLRGQTIPLARGSG